MSDENEQEFREKVRKIGQLVANLDEVKDSEGRIAARELVRLVMAMHGAAVEKMMEIIHARGAGAEIIDKLGRDRVVGSLLALHGLHPDDVETRVMRALEEAGTNLRKQEVEVQVLEATESGVRIRITMGDHACGSTEAAVRTAIEEAVYEAAPEVTSLVIENPQAKPAAGFVTLEQLMRAQRPVPAVTEVGD